MSELEPFGPKTAWIAVLDRTQADVAEALGLAGGREAAPHEAAVAVLDTGVLPPLPGVGGHWTLAVSTELADVSTTRLAALSALLATEVQAFASHRVPEAHRWLAADRGTLLRNLQVVGERGELAAWSGVPTPIETSLGLPAAPVVDGEAAFEVVLAVSEETVLAVAGAWSIDPDSLSGPAPGPALLFDDVDTGPPPPTTPVPEERGLVARLLGRRPTVRRAPGGGRR